MHKFIKGSLYRQFVSLYILTTLIPIIVLGFGSYYITTKSATNNLDAMMEQVVSSVGNQLEDIYRQVDYTSIRLAYSPQVIEFASTDSIDAYQRFEFHKAFDNVAMLQQLILYTNFYAVYIISDSGEHYCRYKNGWDIQMENSRDTIARFQSAQENLPFFGALGILDIKEYPSGRKLLTLARQIFSESERDFTGMVAITIDLSEILRPLSEYSGDSSNLWLMDVNGEVIFKNDTLPSYSLSDQDLYAPLNENLFKERSGEFVTGTGIGEVHGRYITVREPRWRLLITIPSDFYNMPLTSISTTIVAQVLIITFLSVILFYQFFRSVSRPIVNLAKTLQKNNSDIWSPIDPIGNGGEIGELIAGYNQMAMQITTLVDEKVAKETQTRSVQLARRKAELQVLQMQINPHFLYNTFSVIKTYSMINNTPEISAIIDSLSDMFRYSLLNPLEHVHIFEEVEHAKRFLTIQLHRSYEFPGIHWDVENHLDDPIMRLTLQPILENVFEHAFTSRLMGRHNIWITVFCENEDMLLMVRDDGCGMADAPESFSPIDEPVAERMGIGLKNVHRRMLIMYGEGYGITITTKKGEGFTVQARYPQKITDSDEQSKTINETGQPRNLSD